MMTCIRWEISEECRDGLIHFVLDFMYPSNSKERISISREGTQLNKHDFTIKIKTLPDRQRQIYRGSSGAHLPFNN